MKILELLVGIAGLYMLGYCYHCELDERVDSSSIAYDIDTKPELRSSIGYNTYHYWVSNMQFFAFGQIDDPSKAVITAGFYDKDDNSKLVYGLTVDCGSGTWETNYINSTTDTLSVWKSGYLNTTCEQDDYFDIVYELQQPFRGKFLFNGQPMEHSVVGKYRGGEYTGYQRIQRLPVELTNGTHFKAEVVDGGGMFERYAYGKCVAYPDHLMSNCTEATIWGKQRSKGTGAISISIDNVKHYTGHWHVGELGAWTIGWDVTCWSKAPQFFSVVQAFVHNDENSQGKPYCCCSYMNGTLDEASCTSYADLGGACTYTCLSYIDQVVYDTVMAQEELNAASGVNDTFSNVIG